MKVILISGKAEAGKTTSAYYLKGSLEIEGKSAVVLSYGDYTKLLAKKVCGWNGEKDQHGRSLLQHTGNLFRTADPDFFVNVVVEAAYALRDVYDYLIIDDCRFFNEVNVWYELESDFNKFAIRNNYERFVDRVDHIHVVRKGHVSALTDEQLQDASELAGNDPYGVFCDYFTNIVADDIEDLHAKLEYYIETELDICNTHDHCDECPINDICKDSTAIN